MKRICYASIYNAICTIRKYRNGNRNISIHDLDELFFLLGTVIDDDQLKFQISFSFALPYVVSLFIDLDLCNSIYTLT
jgi:hypothetical protein